MTLEEQLRAAKTGDEVELKCGARAKIVNIDNDFATVRIDGLGWYGSDGKNGYRSVGETDQFDIVRFIPKLENGWIRWEGGQCPVDPSATVEVRLAGDHLTHKDKAGDWSWDAGMAIPIIAYRVCDAQPAIDALKAMRGGDQKGLITRATFDALLNILIDRESA